MKKLVAQWLILSVLLGACGSKNGKSEQFIPSAPILTTSINHYQKAETIRYTAKLGLVKAANIVLKTDETLADINDAKCYKVALMGELDGTVDLFSELNDTFYSYVDTHSFKPRLFIRNLQENSYKKLEYNYFDFNNHKLTSIHKNTTNADSVKSYDISENINDLITSYFQLRKIDFEKYAANDTLRIDVFIENASHNLKFLLKKREEIKTKVGRFKAIVLVPIVPPSDFFRGDEPVSIWISDDENRIPLKMKTKSWVGNVEVDIKEYTFKR